MKYSNEECNADNSSYLVECQPTYDTCLTIVLKPGKKRSEIYVSVEKKVHFHLDVAILDEIIITKYCTKRKACERQRNYTHSSTPCQPNNEGRSWGCVSCCGDRDLCNYNSSTRFSSSIFSMLFFSFFCFLLIIYH